MLAFLIMLGIVLVSSRIIVGYYIVPVKKEDVNSSDKDYCDDIPQLDSRIVNVVDVQVEGFDKVCTYLTNGIEYYPGEQIVVPFGRGDKPRLAEVIRYKTITVGDLPVPILKMKTVIVPVDANVLLDDYYQTVDEGPEEENNDFLV